MQRIERYGVIALVFLLVTIVAVSLWGEQRKSGGLFHFLRPDSKSAKVDRLVADVGQDRPPSQPSGTRDAFDRSLPLSQPLEDLNAPRAQRPPPPLAPPSADPLARGPLADQPFVPPEEVPPVEDLPKPRPPVVDTPPPAAPASGPAAGPRKYTVRPGDTLSEIAMHELGSKDFQDRIEAANPGLRRDHILAGQVLILPAIDGSTTSQPVRAASAPPPAPRTAPVVAKDTRRYTVRKGDTLLEIAQHELGTTKRSGEIVAANPGLKPDHIVVGQVLLLPVDASADRAERVASAEAPRRSKVR